MEDECPRDYPRLSDRTYEVAAPRRVLEDELRRFEADDT